MNITEVTRLAKVEQKIENIDNKLDEHVLVQRLDFDKIHQKLDKMGGKFAGKWVEKVALATLVTLIGAFITLVI